MKNKTNQTLLYYTTLHYYFRYLNWGGIAKVSYKISENLTNSFQYSYKYNHIHMDNKGGIDEDFSEIIRDREGEYQVSSVGYTLSYNKLDNLYIPKEGYFLRLSQDISGLWGNVNFLKSEFLSFYTHPILSKIDDDITLCFKAAAVIFFPILIKSSSLASTSLKVAMRLEDLTFLVLDQEQKTKIKVQWEAKLILI